MATSRKPVTFLDSNGNTISNDPLFLAQQTMAEAGVGGKAEDFDIPGPYDHITDGKELKALAKERGISTTGIRKASVFRDLLESWDEEHENDNDDSDSDDDESTGDDDNSDSSNE